MMRATLVLAPEYRVETSGGNRVGVCPNEAISAEDHRSREHLEQKHSHWGGNRTHPEGSDEPLAAYDKLLPTMEGE